MTCLISIPLTNPIQIFCIILAIILLSPIVLNRLRIPHIVGLILAGAIIGPYTLNLLHRDASIKLFSTVGLMYLMFLAGLEIDMDDFKRNRSKSIVFGLFTFSIPMFLGTFISYFLFKFSIYTSVLLASIFASHTLIAYPIISRFGIVRNKAVNIAVGGTIITDTLALLVLAIIVGLVKDGIGQAFWIRMSLSMVIFVFIVLVGFPVMSRWFFKKEGDHISQYIFVLLVVFISAFLSELAGVEAIIGAFLAGLSLNRLIPKTSPLMNRIDFIGNAIFIPFFLIGVGMLVDFSAFVSSKSTIIVALMMTVTATVSKYLAAFITSKTFKLDKNEFLIIFGLSNAQAAATLAAVTVGYNIVLGYDSAGNPQRLLNDDILNGTIVMILITCTIASFATYKSAKNIAMHDEFKDNNQKKSNKRILIPLSNPQSSDLLIELGILLSSVKNTEPLYALSLITDHSNNPQLANAQHKLLDNAIKIGASTNTRIEPVTRYDINVANGIIFTAKELNISDIIIGLHKKKSVGDSFIGNLTNSILTKTSQILFIYKPTKQIGSINKIIVCIPENSEYEFGFINIFERIINISNRSGGKICIYSPAATRDHIFEIRDQLKINNLEFIEIDQWEMIGHYLKDIRNNDLLVIISARKNSISYKSQNEKLSMQLAELYPNNSLLIAYPGQDAGEFVKYYKSNVFFDKTYDANIHFITQLGIWFKKLMINK